MGSYLNNKRALDSALLLKMDAENKIIFANCYFVGWYQDSFCQGL